MRLRIIATVITAGLILSIALAPAASAQTLKASVPKTITLIGADSFRAGSKYALGVKIVGSSYYICQVVAMDYAPGKLYPQNEVLLGNYKLWAGITNKLTLALRWRAGQYMQIGVLCSDSAGKKNFKYKVLYVR